MPHYSNFSKDSFIKVIDYTLITGALQKPITLEEVKQRSRIDGDDLDNDLCSFINAVTLIAEKITGRDLLTKTYKGYLDCFPCNSQGIQIRKSKLQTIVSIQYLVDNVLTTFDSSNYYITDKQEFSEIWLFDEKLYPINADINRKQVIEITFTAGYGSKPCDIPLDFKNAMLTHVNYLNENRGDCPDETAISNQIAQFYLPYIISHKLFNVT